MKKGAGLLVVVLAVGLGGCGHTLSRRIGLMSFGNLQGKEIPSNGEGNIVEGKDCGYSYNLSNAARDALKGTSFDTLIDVDVTNSTGVLVPSNCLIVRGKALDSTQLADEGATP